MFPQLRSVGEDAILLSLADTASEATLDRVQAAVRQIELCLGDELVDLVPSYASVLIQFDPLRCSHAAVRERLRGALQGPAPAPARATPRECLVLPALYGPEAGEDLERLAARAGLTSDEVVALHAGRDYRVYAIGFAPGFAYLGQVDERIAAPRLATPRQSVPRGAVAIADRQTAVYPAPSPGGWNLIGLCPTPMFNPTADPPMPLAVGDRVRFEPVSRDRFLALGGELP